MDFWHAMIALWSVAIITGMYAYAVYRGSR